MACAAGLRRHYFVVVVVVVGNRDSVAIKSSIAVVAADTATSMVGLTSLMRFTIENTAGLVVTLVSEVCFVCCCLLALLCAACSSFIVGGGGAGRCSCSVVLRRRVHALAGC